jgi:predicted phosphodiesterase
MRVAALYDIHGNLPALDAVLAEVDDEDVDRMVIGGDVVPGPLPAATLERLRGLGDRAVFVRGNGDRWVVEAFDALASAGAEPAATRRPWAEWSARAIDRRDRDLLASFVDRVVLDVDGVGPVLFCHGSPRDDDEVLTSLTPAHRWGPALAGVVERVVVCGHTHSQFDVRMGSRRVVNAGAVGLPYEGRAGAYWLLLGPGVEHRRTDYDLDRAVVRMRAGGNPNTEQLLTDSLLRPVDPRTVAETLEHQARELASRGL